MWKSSPKLFLFVYNFLIVNRLSGVGSGRGAAAIKSNHVPQNNVGASLTVVFEVAAALE